MPHRCATWFVLVVLLCAPLTGSIAAAQEPLAIGSQDDNDGTDVLGAFGDSFKLLLIEHAWRIAFQEKTRAELGGKFWLDYQRSVRMPRQWGDTDAGWVNYLGHPIHGAGAGYIWLDHDPSAPGEFSLTRRYWTSRVRAMVFAGAYSLQFEIGPLSEASLGNVGMRPETTGWVDHVITPVGAFGLIVVEDALDRYVVRWTEERVPNIFLRMLIRLAANPGRTLSNSASGRSPWHRDGRPIAWR
ncbi:MAG TPA: hypothetical protein VKA59_19465 [Vicinamibacterales bacterium]|nr:hypothetical protein [Vicinamibacterales bacterium]